MRWSTALAYTGVTFSVAAVGYAMYFDYRRRNDVEFRKLLRKQSKQSSKQAHREEKAAKKEQTAMIEQAIKDVAKPGVLPTGVQEKEKFFMEQVATGEALFAQGPSLHVPAAIAFFRALKVYPAPVELVMIYQKAVPKEVFDLIMKLVTKDAAVNGGSTSELVPPTTGGDLDEVDDEVPGKPTSNDTAQEQQASEAE
ncbi:mitochondrial import receptor subunit tom20 [Malassezia psittaci]|uniref:Mitochondrial import receptor subunit TOM20 n=1 Tax=Malassezia psittaci TaxID=1821823 RepID=A0AAF0JFS3_9BASI|nr:mitochondrial import receptor subunit tom20 [Malassezia psittaci]